MRRCLTGGSVWILAALVALVACGGGGGETGEETVSRPAIRLVFPAEFERTGSAERQAPSFVTKITVTASPVDGGDASTWIVPLDTGLLDASLPPGTYLFSVVVETTMGTVFSGSATVTLSPGGAPPTISINVSVASLPVIAGGISISNRSPFKGESVRLSVTAIDPDSSETLVYQWSGGGGTVIGSGSSVQWVSSVSGDFTVSVTVTDDRGDAATASTTLTVTNRAPVISSATASSYAPTVGDTVALACAATDQDDDPITYRWNGSDGFTATGASANYTVTTATTVTLTCSVDDGDTDGVATATVTLNGTEPPPGAPGGMTGTAGDTQVSLSWNAVAGATSYNVYWATTTGTGVNGTKIAGVTATSYTHTARTNWTPLYYVVTAVGPGGEGTPSAEATATPRPAGLLVTKTADTADGVCDTDCSLREAITVLNGGGGGAIALPAGTYAIGIAGANEDLNATGDFDIRANITINGAGSGTTVIDGASLDRVLHVTGAYTVGVSGVTLKGGALGASGLGGGLYNGSGTVTLASSVITGNTAGTAGGIYSTGGTITLQNSTVSANTQTGGVTGATGGGGVWVSNTTLISTGTTFSGNVAANGNGGAIYLRNSALTATGSTFSANHGNGNDGGGSSGGAVYIEDGSSTASFSGTTFQSNYTTGGFGGAGGAITFEARSGSLTIADSTFTSNWAEYGGAIRVWLGKTTSITRSTFNGNTGNGWDQGGAALHLNPHSYATVQVSNSTIVSNNTSGGGAVFTNVTAGGSVTITHCTIAQNSKYGINATGAGATTLINTLLATNAVGSCMGAVTSGGNNIDSANTCAFAGAGDLVNTDPLLNALAANGGSTQTMALSVGSPAIDTGNATVCAAAPVGGIDQRGGARPRGAGCDIGAYEY